MARNGPRRTESCDAAKLVIELVHEKELQKPLYNRVGVCGMLTRNDVARVHRILVFDKAESIHQLNLGNLTSAMGREVSFDIGLGSWLRVLAATTGRHAKLGQALLHRNTSSNKLFLRCRYKLLTTLGQVSQVEPGSRNLSGCHD